MGDDIIVWNICVFEGKKLICCDKSVFSYFKGFLLFNINFMEVEIYLDEFREVEVVEVNVIVLESKLLEFFDVNG